MDEEIIEFESYEYVIQHRKEVVRAAEKLSEYINNRIIGINAVKDLTKELLRRAYEHDDDKVMNEEVLSLYDKKFWDECPDEEKKRYYELHKLGNKHHVDYFMHRDIDMGLVDILEFICDNYASTNLRQKPIDAEIIFEQKVAGFSNQYRDIIFNAFATINPKYRQEIITKYPSVSRDMDICYLIRRELLYKDHRPFITKLKKEGHK